MSIRIVTDSACDLPDDVIADLGITVVPLTIRFGSTEYVDRQDLTPGLFWELCGNSDTLPSTAAPGPGQFSKAYADLIADGATGIVSIHLSGELSATLQSARNAIGDHDGQVPVVAIDSRSITVGLGLMVVAAAERARDGATLDDVVGLAESLVDRTRVLGALDTLEYLQKGGRIGSARAMIGSMLSIKPLIAIENGVVEEGGRQRTRRRALDALVKEVAAQPAIERLAVMHAACDDVDAFLSRLGELYDGDILVGDIGPVIGAHAGPGTIGVIYHVPAA